NIWIFMDIIGIIYGDKMEPLKDLTITPEMLKLITELDEWRGRWRSLGWVGPERLSALRRAALIDSVGAATRVQGSRLTDREIERLVSSLGTGSFGTPDEQKIAGYASALELVLEAWAVMPLAESSVKELHGAL